MKKISLSSIISFLIILVTIISVNPWSTFPLGNTASNWLINLATLISFILGKKYYYNEIKQEKNWQLSLYLIWVFICIIRGAFEVRNYWEVKNLINTIFFILVPFTFYCFNNRKIVQHILYKWFKYALPIFFVIGPLFLRTNHYGFYLIPISLMLLFLPALKTKWKFIILFLTFLVLTGYFNRSSVLKYSFALLLPSLYYFRNLFFFTTLTKMLRIILMFIPLLFISLAINGTFNVFEMEEYLGEQKTEKEVNGVISEESLTADSRTFLYKEVISSAINNNYVIFGRTPARGNDSEAFGVTSGKILETERFERAGNEVCMLNIFTWFGLIGVCLYFLIFLRGSYLAIYKSNNLYVKLIGLYIAFRWVMAWIEDVNRFNIVNIILWMMIGMCFSEQFRAMSNREFKYWVWGVFDKKYRLKQITDDKDRHITHSIQS